MSVKSLQSNILTKFRSDCSSNAGRPSFITISSVSLLLENSFSLHSPRAMCEFVIHDYNRLKRTPWCCLKYFAGSVLVDVVVI